MDRAGAHDAQYVVVVEVMLMQTETVTGSRFRPRPEEFEMLHLALAESGVTMCDRPLAGWATAPISDWKARVGAHCPQCHHVQLPGD